MYRAYHHPSFSLDNCIILSNRMPLAYVPKQFTYYFINSKRRFFLYMKHKDEMDQLIKIFQKQNVKFYQRKSIFPDRQENQEIVYHCNYKYKKKDLRWTLKPETRFRQPKNRFHQGKAPDLKYQTSNILIQTPKTFESNKNLEIQEESIVKEGAEANEKQIMNIEAEQTGPQYVADFGEIKIKNQQVLDIINNIQLMKALFKAERQR